MGKEAQKKKAQQKREITVKRWKKSTDIREKVVPTSQGENFPLERLAAMDMPMSMCKLSGTEV